MNLLILNIYKMNDKPQPKIIHKDNKFPNKLLVFPSEHKYAYHLYDGTTLLGTVGSAFGNKALKCNNNSNEILSTKL